MKTVVGLYDKLSNARDVVDDLVSAGFDPNEISLVASDRDKTYSAYLERDDEADEAAEGAVAGALAGGAFGGLAGVLLGLGAFAIPGLGPVVAAGPIVAGLAGAGIGAATGGVLGALIGWGIPEEEAEIYAEGVRRGGTLVAVRAAEHRVDEAVEIMYRHDPVDVERRSEYWRSTGWTGYDPDVEAYTATEVADERARYDTYVEEVYYNYEPAFRRHYATAFVDRGYDYNRYEPGYRYGTMLATDARYRDYDSWNEIEAEARRGWERTERAAEGTWEELKDSVRHAWEEVKDAFDADEDVEYKRRVRVHPYVED
ncbi:MAG TPA: general stress protein [Anaerolineae bacterium]